jgi:hypothetical protein
MFQPECNRYMQFGGMRVKVFLGSISLLLTLSVCLAQSDGRKSNKKTPPDLSGIWMLDYSRSSLDPAMKKKIADYVLTIVHREPEIRISRKYKEGGREHLEERVYYTNGRTELNSRGGIRDPESITRWQGDKLVRKTTASPRGIRTSPPLEVVTIEEWKLSPDGKTLTRTTTTSGIIMSRVKYVFVRS